MKSYEHLFNLKNNIKLINTSEKKWRTNSLEVADQIIFIVLFFSKLWDALTGDELHTFAHKHIVKSVDFASDGEHLLTGSNEKILRIFDLNNTDAGTVL